MSQSIIETISLEYIPELNGTNLSFGSKMKLFVIFATIFTVEICAGSNLDISSDVAGSDENIPTVLAQLSYSKSCVYKNGKYKCQESINNGDGQPTKTKTYSGSGSPNRLPFEDLFGNLGFDLLGDHSPLFGNDGKRSSRTSKTRSSQISQIGRKSQKTKSIPNTPQGSETISQTGRNSQKTQSIPNTQQGSGTARDPKFKIVNPSPETIPTDADDVLI